MRAGTHPRSLRQLHKLLQRHLHPAKPAQRCLVCTPWVCKRSGASEHGNTRAAQLNSKCAAATPFSQLALVQAPVRRTVAVEVHQIHGLRAREQVCQRHHGQQQAAAHEDDLRMARAAPSVSGRCTGGCQGAGVTRRPCSSTKLAVLPVTAQSVCAGFLQHSGSPQLHRRGPTASAVSLR